MSHPDMCCLDAPREMQGVEEENVCHCNPCRCSSSLELELNLSTNPNGCHCGMSTLNLSFYVGGMTCASCAQRLTTALQRVRGVVSAHVSFISQQAEVEVCAVENASVAASVMACVARLGFTVSGSQTSPDLPNALFKGNNSASGSVGKSGLAHEDRGSQGGLPGGTMSQEGRRLADALPSSAMLLALTGGGHPLSSSEDGDDEEEVEDGAEHPGAGNATRGTQEDKALCSDATSGAARGVPRMQPQWTKTMLLIEGMSCGSCAARIEGELLRVAGVKEASVNFAVMSGRVVHDAAKITAADLLRAVKSIGYNPSLQSSRAVAPAGVGASTSRARQAASDRSGHNKRDDSAASISILIDSDDEGSWPGQRSRRLPREDRAKSHATAASFPTSTTAAGGAKYIHRFLVEGMSCASCAGRIERTLRALPFVVDCTVSFATGAAVATTNHNFSDDNLAVEAAIRDLGYPVTALGRRKQNPATVTAQHPSYQTLAQPEADEQTAAIAFTDAAADAGGDVNDDDLARTRAALERKQEIDTQRGNFINAAILTVPLVIAMLIMAFTDLMDTTSAISLTINAVQLLCATPIVVICGNQFFVGAWRSFQHGAYTMDTLVAIGTGCSYLYSLVAFAVTLLSGMHIMTYFDTAGMLTTFMLLGRFLEANAKRTTSGALIELMSLVPAMATVVTGDGDVRVATSALQVGDHVRVRASDRIPVDATIVEGQSDIDEQLVTGESVPKPCGRGDRVVGGTLNVTATLVLVVDKVGEDTLLSQILKIVQEAQNTKPAVQRIADQLAMYFVPFVVGSSLVTLAAWLFLGFFHAYPARWRPHGVPAEAFAFNFFIATVVAACPCALGLATPTAIMVGTGVGAQNGVLVKSGVTLEMVRKTDCVVFDKTGTVTTGQLKVCGTQSFHVAHGAPLQLVKRLVVAVEEQSTHPIAKAVARDVAAEAERETATPREMQTDVLSDVTHAGRGVEAVVAVTEALPRSRLHGAVPAYQDVDDGGQHVQEYRVLVGNLAFMQEQHQRVGHEVTNAVQQCHSQGQTTVVAAVDGRVVLVVSLADQPKPEATGVMEYLHRHHIRTLMVTGDNRLVAASVARSVGISFDNIRAETMPADKAAIVKELQGEGQRVMFVGDGINDSPALAQADVGVALGAGTEVAIEAADAVLVRNSLVDLLSLRKLSNVTVRRIYGNFAWAFGYNVLMLPLASGLLYPLLGFQLPPVVAGAAMAMSSLSVLASSLTIRCFKPYRPEQFINTAWQ